VAYHPSMHTHMLRAQDTITICCPVVTQYAALGALQVSESAYISVYDH